MSAFTDETWPDTPVFAGRCATRADVDAGHAVFALAETVSGQPLDWMLPQPVIWHDEEEVHGALVIQAESHAGEAGEVLEALGLLLPDGRTAIAFSEEVEEVDGTDADWLALIGADDGDADEG